MSARDAADVAWLEARARGEHYPHPNAARGAAYVRLEGALAALPAPASTPGWQAKVIAALPASAPRPGCYAIVSPAPDLDALKHAAESAEADARAAHQAAFDRDTPEAHRAASLAHQLAYVALSRLVDAAPRRTRHERGRRQRWATAMGSHAEAVKNSLARAEKLESWGAP